MAKLKRRNEKSAIVDYLNLIDNYISEIESILKRLDILKLKRSAQVDHEKSRSLESEKEEMEEYFMMRIQYYLDETSKRVADGSNDCMEKYIHSLITIKELKTRIKELEIKNNYYKSNVWKK
jgi:hypothetical protein